MEGLRRESIGAGWVGCMRGVASGEMVAVVLTVGGGGYGNGEEKEEAR